MNQEYSERVSRLRGSVLNGPRSAVLISSRVNCHYLSGFTGSNGYLLVAESRAVIFTDFRYLEQAKNECPGFEVVQISGGYEPLAKVVTDMSLECVSFESLHTSYAHHQRIRSALTDRIFLNPAEGAVERLRSTKDESEIELLEAAVNLADSAMEQALQSVHTGVTEIEIAKVIEACLRELGADAVAFDTIVGAGVNGAMPHHRADQTLIKKGDPVVIDMGALFKGYRSDLTRTVLADPSGKDNEKFEEIYGIVLESQLAAEKAAEPGMKAADLDKISRGVIKKSGYGTYFGHGLGHGVGLDIHERPMVVPSSSDVIEVGSVFTIEPGIYLPDWGGVRIEDVLLMEESGPRVLTKSPK